MSLKTTAYKYYIIIKAGASFKMANTNHTILMCIIRQLLQSLTWCHDISRTWVIYSLHKLRCAIKLNRKHLVSSYRGTWENRYETDSPLWVLRMASARIGEMSIIWNENSQNIKTSKPVTWRYGCKTSNNVTMGPRHC